MSTAVVQQEWNEALWNNYVAKHDPKLRERIIGAIIDALRSLDQIPRTARQRAREIEAAIIELEAKLKRPPYDEEVAKHLRMDVDKYREACVRTNVSTLSLDSLLSTDDEDGPGGGMRAFAFEDRDSPDPVSTTERRELE